MATCLVLLDILWIPFGLGLHHESIANRLEYASCRVEMSHREWAEVGPSSVVPGTEVVRQSTLPRWIDQSPLQYAVRRVHQVTIRGRSNEEFDEAIRILANLGSVPTISVYAPGFSSQHLNDLMRHVEVKSLYLRGVNLPRTRLPSVSQEGLTWLAVCHTQFSNPAIKDLPQSIEYFDATRTRINDEGLDDFVTLTNLSRLNLSRTPTSEKAVERLREKMPWCKIRWEQLRIPTSR